MQCHWVHLVDGTLATEAPCGLKPAEPYDVLQLAVLLTILRLKLVVIIVCQQHRCREMATQSRTNHCPRVVELNEPLDGRDSGGHDSCWGDSVLPWVEGTLAAEAPHGLKEAEPEGGPKLAVLLAAVGLPRAFGIGEQHRHGARPGSRHQW